MLNNFIYAQTKDLFLEHLNADNVPEEAIVFIEDTKQIGNRGTYFGGDEIDQSVISDIQTSIAELQNSKVNIDILNAYAKKTDLPDLSAYLTNDSANAIYATISQYNDLNSKVDNNTADIANLQSVGAQKNVQSDGNATTGDALILNKPDLSVYLKSTDASSTYATLTVTNNIQTSVDNLSGEVSSNKSLTETVGNRVSTLEGYFATTEDTDDIINQGKDVVDFLEGISDSENLDAILAAKANQSALDDVTSKVAELENKRDGKDVNNKIRSGNEFNIVPNNYTNSRMWFNYRTDNDTSLENPIEEYIFGRGIADPTSNHASLLASGYKVDGGTSSQFLKADGSVDGTSYLPTSGGTLTNTLILQGAADNKLILNNTDGEQFNQISIRENNTEYGYLLWTSAATHINGKGNLVYNGNILLHSGNVGEYKAGSANILATTYAENINYAAYTTELKLIKYDEDWEANGFPNKWTSGLSVMAGYSGWQLVTYGGSADTPYFRKVSDSGAWSNWRALAFTDSDITGNAATATTATKLSTVSKTAWGQTYGTSEGVPTNISGAMAGVTDITMSGSIKMGSGAANIIYDSAEKCIKFTF